MEKVQEMLVSEGVIALLIAVVVAGAREWRRVQLAGEKRGVREQELLARVGSNGKPWEGATGGAVRRG